MPKPPAAVIPLGTGNGMSVNLGWGHKASKQWVRDQKSMAGVSLPPPPPPLPLTCHPVHASMAICLCSCSPLKWICLLSLAANTVLVMYHAYTDMHVFGAKAMVRALCKLVTIC